MTVWSKGQAVFTAGELKARFTLRPRATGWLETGGSKAGGMPALCGKQETP